MGSWRIITGDCLDAMAALSAASVDAIVTDPPYLLGFMGRDWDTIERRAAQEHHRAWATEALRVLKPGGHLLAFGGTRTYHRLTAGIEDAGFEIRDTIAWLYGSGFPKSLDVGKAIDKAAGAEREVVGARKFADGTSTRKTAGHSSDKYGEFDGGGLATIPATPAAEQWDGWGTALKPAHEPIVVARKPLAGTVAANVLAHGTGALNIHGCRIDATGERFGGGAKATSGFVNGYEHGDGFTPNAGRGRWPANVALDEEAAAMLDEQTGDLPAGIAVNRNRQPGTMTSWLGTRASQVGEDVGYGDTGGASRFFYVAKADGAERNAGLSVTSLFSPDDAPERNDHPTVKPIDLMRWLVRLVTPPGGTVLDPFAGSGTTGAAAILEGATFTGIERDPHYAAIARARLTHWASGNTEAPE